MLKLKYVYKWDMWWIVHYKVTVEPLLTYKKELFKAEVRLYNMK